MIDANILSEKLKQLAERIAKVRAHCPEDPEDLAHDGDRLDLVSFNLLVSVQICLDLATHLIAGEGWAPAATAREAFERLEQKGVLSKETVQALRKSVGLRNIVVHGYSGVDPSQVHAAATVGLPDLERFAGELSAWVRAQAD